MWQKLKPKMKLDHEVWPRHRGNPWEVHLRPRTNRQDLEAQVKLAQELHIPFPEIRILIRGKESKLFLVLVIVPGPRDRIAEGVAEVHLLKIWKQYLHGWVARQGIPRRESRGLCL